MPSKFKLDRQAEKGQHRDASADQAPKSADITGNSSDSVDTPQKNESRLHSIQEVDSSNVTSERRPEIIQNYSTTGTRPQGTCNEHGESVDNKVQRYESFVEDTLRAKLREIAVCAIIN